MDSISWKRNQLISKIDINHNLSVILTELRNYILLVMKRDISNISIQYRNELANNIIDYIIQAYQNGYFTDDNISLCLNKIITSSSSFYAINDPSIYADCTSNKIGFNFKNSFAISNMRHFIFHEMTHSVANLHNQNLGIKEWKENHVNSALNIKNRTDKYIPVISDKMLTFLDEIMAESTACKLSQTYSQKKQVIPGVFSDWLTPYNRSYQELGYYFLKTLDYDDSLSEREVFELFTKNSINNNQTICSHILNIYERKNPDTWKDDLNKITTILGDLTTTHKLEESNVIEAKKLMTKYLTQKNISNFSINDTPTIKIISRTDDNNDFKPKITIH